MALTTARLRADAIRRAFFAPASLKKAITRMGFVQADPIRSPARAQDLILRHRAVNYRAGELERRYTSLDIEEDFLYAYGFLPRQNWRLLHPRDRSGLTELDRRVLRLVTDQGALHPRELEEHLGSERAINAWGGYSKATTRSLEKLHYHGLLRIARRENGIRIYETAPAHEEHLSPAERSRQLILLLSRIFAPSPLPCLKQVMRFLSRAAPTLNRQSSIINDLLRSGELESGSVEGTTYIWPTGKIVAAEPPEVVRFLAPFDPLIWDRKRLELFWGWQYRFEAYTPAAKRRLGYYAMPVLWRDRIIGWANISAKDGKMDVKLGYVETRPAEKAFRSALEAEVERMRWFLGCDE
jgi:uncharacterized protein